MKKYKFEISKFTSSGGKNIGIRKSEFVTKTQFPFSTFNINEDIENQIMYLIYFSNVYFFDEW